MPEPVYPAFETGGQTHIVVSMTTQDTAQAIAQCGAETRCLLVVAYATIDHVGCPVCRAAVGAEQ